MLLLLLWVILIVVYIGFRPTIDKLSNGDVVLWYNSMPFLDPTIREYIFLKRNKTF